MIEKIISDKVVSEIVISTAAGTVTSIITTGSVQRMNLKEGDMQQWKPGAHANTYGANPLCCAAALVTLDLIEREYAANAEKVGAIS